MSERVVCPHCARDFELTSVMRKQLEVELRSQLREEIEREKLQARELGRRDADAELARRDASVQQLNQKLADAVQTENDLKRREREAIERLQRAAVDEEEKIATACQRATEAATRQAEDRLRREAERQLRVKQDEIAAFQKDLDEAAARELEFKRREREAQERARNFESELSDRLAAEGTRVREEATRATEERLRRESAEQIRSRDDALGAAKHLLAEAAANAAELMRREREAIEKAQRAAIDLEEKLAAETQRLRRDAEDERVRSATVLEQRLAEETARVREEATRRAEERFQRESKERLRARDEELAAAKQSLTEFMQDRDARAVELNDLLRKKQELEDEALRLKTEADRKMLIEADRIREQMRSEARERMDVEQDRARFRDQEHAQQLEGLQRTIDELQQKVTQGSQQLQGEAQEVILKDVLVTTFRWDEIVDVEKGVQGADLLQTVRDADGSPCGTIIWESKRTKHWSDDWLAKLQDDQRAKTAACAVLVSQAMPGDIHRFGMKDGIWVCEWPYAGPLAAALRVGIIQTARVRRSEEGP